MSQIFILPAEQLMPSWGDTTYFIDPVNGDDANAGTQASKAWKSLAKINALKLGPGDKVVIAPGVLEETFKPCAFGTQDNHVVIQFATGRRVFRADRAIKLCYFISNCADAPKEPRPIGILIKNCHHLQITGGGNADIWYGDRMTELINDHAEDILFAGLNFDFIRPTVSEYRVLETSTNSVICHVAEGSTYTPLRKAGSLGPATSAWDGPWCRKHSRKSGSAGDVAWDQLTPPKPKTLVVRVCG